MRISDWSSDVCSSDLVLEQVENGRHLQIGGQRLFGDAPVGIEVRKAGSRLGATRRGIAANLIILLGQIGQPLEIEGIEALNHARLGENRGFVGKRAQVENEIGRESCRERGCQYVEISVGEVSLKNTATTVQTH